MVVRGVGKYASLAVALWAAGAAFSFAQTAPSADGDLSQLSLEDLLAVDVTSVAKKRQKVDDAAAAVFVISQEDIHRSGMHSIPELLRMVPGLEVTQEGGGTWTVSIRGFASTLTDKVLVMIDGRSVYMSPLATVNWDTQLVPVEDIERIEIVRGSGGAIWGANAVNGVINIVTRHAADTQHGLATLQSDGQGGQRAYMRYGWRLNDSAALRVYAETTDNRTDTSGDILNKTLGSQAGFRADADATAQDAFSLQGDAQYGRFSDSVNVTPDGTGGGFSGYNLVGRWTRSLSDASGMTLQAYADHVTREAFNLMLNRDEYNIDFSHNFAFGAAQHIVWGLTYRRDDNNVTNSTQSFIHFDPAHEIDTWYGGFAQDEIALTPQFKISLGAKLEKVDHIGGQFEPSARFIWALGASHFWGAVSRSVRTPSLLNTAGSYMLPVSGANGQETVVLPLSDDAAGIRLKPEAAVSYELGWRAPLSRTTQIDLSAYDNTFKDRLVALLTPLGIENRNTDSPSNAKGVEAALNTQVSDRLTIKFAGNILSQSFISDLYTNPSLSPRAQTSVRAWYDFSNAVDGEAWLRHVASIDEGAVPAYTDLDLRLAWRPTVRLEISLLGQNLLHRERTEYPATNAYGPAVAPRRLAVVLQGRF